MDYKKAYNEALEKAKEVERKYSHATDTYKEIINIFPELKETEEEKIRKELKHYLEVRRCQTNDDNEYINCNHFLSWLEKQKPSAGWSEHQHKLLNYAMSMTEDTEVKKFLESLRNHPIQKQEWNEEDENTRNKIIGSLDALKFYVEKNNEFDDERIESNLKELDDEIEWLQDIVPQQKQEWSEDIINRGIKEVGLTQYQIDWLKKNVMYKSKQEWSEKDYNFINELCGLLASISKDGYVGKYYTVDLVEKLKSLKPQPHWKPSEEQVEALKFFINSYHKNANEATTGWKVYDNLISLYEKLRKL